MNAAILSVGTEILFGQIVNTNSVYLSRQLNMLGFDVLFHHTVGDNEKRLSETLSNSLDSCDIVVTTGGLGPTEDDMTKETVCSVLGDKLVKHEPSLRALEALAKKRKYGKLTENNYKQAMMPSKAVVFPNPNGTAPAFALEMKGKYVISLPGPPREMMSIFESEVKPFLKPFQDGAIVYRTIRLFGIGESTLETRLLDLINSQTDPTIATYAKEGECSVRVASKRKTEEEAKRAVDEVVDIIKGRFADYIFSCDDEELVDVVAGKLIAEDISFSLAESCTGGRLAAKLVSVPGISKVFDRGLVTYTEKAKTDELGVNPETIEKFSVYSREVAIEMVRGLSEKTGSKLCVSVTGVLDSGEKTPDLQPGSAYVALKYKDKLYDTLIQGRNINREWNGNYLVLCILNLINKTIDA